MRLEHETRLRNSFAALTEAMVEALTSTPQEQPTRLLSIARASAILGIGRTRMYVEIGSGRLASVKVGRRRLIPAIAVESFARGDGSEHAAEVDPTRVRGLRATD